MENYQLSENIKVLYKTATSFPEGVLAAHQQLHALVPYSSTRRYFGLSRPEIGKIVYHAAMEEMEKGEAEKFSCETMEVKKGDYIYVDIKDFMKDIPSIQRAFNELLKHPDLDPQGYCVEWYLNQQDVRCMIRIIT
jgi:hypothetical protein